MKGAAAALFALLLATLSVPAAAKPATLHEQPDVAEMTMPINVEGRRQVKRSRVMAVVDGEITDARLAELGEHAQVHGWIDQHSIVALTPRGARGRQAIEALPYVSSVVPDAVRYLTEVGTWDRDILDVTDVEESGAADQPIDALLTDSDAREVGETGAGVHVAVIDTGLVRNWRDFFDPSWVRADLARAFMGGGAVAEDFVPVNEFDVSSPPNLWERDTNSHGTAVASHVVGFNLDTARVDGVAPDARIIPLKVFPNGQALTWSSRIIAGIAYITQLREDGVIGPTVINLSLGSSVPGVLERAAIRDAIDAGVIVVASAGNAGEDGMGWPGAYPEVISAGAIGWTEQFQPGTTDAEGDVSSFNLSFWWNQDVGFDPDTPPSETSVAFVTDFSSRARSDLAANSDTQELDVLAPGLWTAAPGGHGPTSQIFFWAGTSFSAPLTSGVAALLLENDTALSQADVEEAMTSTALPLDADGSRTGVLDPIVTGTIYDPAWDTNCGTTEEPVDCDPVGSGLLQADAALDAVQ